MKYCLFLFFCNSTGLHFNDAQGQTECVLHSGHTKNRAHHKIYSVRSDQWEATNDNLRMNPSKNRSMINKGSFSRVSWTWTAWCHVSLQAETAVCLMSRGLCDASVQSKLLVLRPQGWMLRSNAPTSGRMQYCTGVQRAGGHAVSAAPLRRVWVLTPFTTSHLVTRVDPV